jgi:hypothetical protein
LSAIALDPLIAEAQRRARRRRWWIAGAAAALVAGAGLAIFRSGPPSADPFSMQRPGSVSRLDGDVSRASAFPRMTIGAVGSSGGVTWAANGGGIWLTSDGGGTWRAVPRGVARAALSRGSQYVDAQFVDRQHGWIAGSSGVARTTDGGHTWQTSSPGDCAGCGVEGISFLDASHGFLFAATRRLNYLFSTSDGGRTWHLVSTPEIWGPIQFVSPSVGFAGGPGPMIEGPYQGPPIVTLFRTLDGGKTWSKYLVAGSDSFALLPIGVFGDSVVLGQNGRNRKGGLNLNPGTVWTSGDVGAHWRGRPAPLPEGSGVSSFTVASPGTWGFSAQHDLWLTSDGGARWRDISLRGLPKYDWIRRIVFSSSRVGWALLPVGRAASTLFRTTDGGRHWTPAGPRKPRAHTHG